MKLHTHLRILSMSFLFILNKKGEKKIGVVSCFLSPLNKYTYTLMRKMMPTMTNKAATPIRTFANVSKLFAPIKSHDSHCSSSFKFNNRDRKSTRLNSSHVAISYAVFCLKKKRKKQKDYLNK